MKEKCEHQWTEEGITCVNCGKSRITTTRKSIPIEKQIYIVERIETFIVETEKEAKSLLFCKQGKIIKGKIKYEKT